MGSDDQYAFAKDVSLLLIYLCLAEKYSKFSIGHVYRSPVEQEALYHQGFSKAQYGQHNKKLAIDINFWVRGDYAMNWDRDKLRETLRDAGEYWESLNEKNQWGGFWEFFDAGHFERQD